MCLLLAEIIDSFINTSLQHWYRREYTTRPPPNTETLAILKVMAEIVILLAIKKIGTALENGVADQASTQFAKYGTQLLELQASMDRLVRGLSVMHDVLCPMGIRNHNNAVYE